jgi:hypothetical protein
MRSLWQNRSGMGYPLAIVIVLVVLLLSCCIFEYFRLSIIAAKVRDAAQSAVLSVATENYDLVYSGLRQSYSGGYTRSGNGWTETWTTGDVYKRISQELGLIQEGSNYVRRTSNQTEYSISGLKVKIINSPFAPSSHSPQQFTAEAQIRLTVPLSFGWGHLPPMQAHLTVKAVYRPRF